MTKKADEVLKDLCFIVIVVLLIGIGGKCFAEYSDYKITSKKDDFFYITYYEKKLDKQGKEVEVEMLKDDRRVSDLQEERQRHLDRIDEIDALLQKVSEFELTP